jgi:hypothetical protein
VIDIDQLPLRSNIAFSTVTLPAMTDPSGRMLSRGTTACGPIVQSRPMLASRPMKVNGSSTVSAPIVAPLSTYVFCGLTIAAPAS